MPTTDFATNIALPGAKSDAQILDAQSDDPQLGGGQRAFGRASKPATSRPLKGLFFGFAFTVAVGLGLASWYISVRVAAANALPAPVPAAALPAFQEDSTAGAVPDSVPPANLYLQVAGLGIRQDAELASSLQAKGFRAQVQMRDGATTRFLIGPFSTHVELEQVHRKLQSAGVLAVETTF